MTDLSNVTRIEVIDVGIGRRYLRYGARPEVSIQDAGRTLKIFVRPREGGEFAAAPQGEYVIDPRNPPRAWWPMGNIFRGIKQEWRSIAIGTFVDGLLRERARTDLYGYVLMACISEQVAFFAALYDRHFPDDDVQLALRSLCKHGKVPDLMDAATGELLLFTAYNAIMEARGKL